MQMADTNFLEKLRINKTKKENSKIWLAEIVDINYKDKNKKSNNNWQ